MFTWESFLFWEAFRKHLPTPGQEEQLSRCLMYSHMKTHMLTWAQAMVLVLIFTACTIHSDYYKSYAMSHIFISNFISRFCAQAGTPSIDPVTIQALLLNNGHFMVPYPTVETNRYIFHPSEINDPLGSFTNHSLRTTASSHCKKKG